MIIPSIGLPATNGKAMAAYCCSCVLVFGGLNPLKRFRRVVLIALTIGSVEFGSS